MLKQVLDKKCIIFSVIIMYVHTWIPLPCQDIIHFYRATPLFPEPRFEKPWLFSLDFLISGGKTDQSKNQHSQNVPLFDIFSSPPVDSSCAHTKSHYHCHNNGTFSIVEAYITATQNITRGFFLQSSIPIRYFHVEKKYLCHTPEPSCIPRIYPYQQTGVGDWWLGAGWTINYQETQELDFIDVTVRAGIVCPTGKKRNPYQPTSIAHGYNGYWGFPFAIESAIGAFEWLTVGIHAETVPFVPHKEHFLIDNRSDLSLHRACGRISLGTIWWIGAYLKADHAIGGLSFITGYSYAGQGKTTITLPQGTVHSPTLVPFIGQPIERWSMHTVHIDLEYDFTKEHHTIGPRIHLFSNIHVDGTYTFNTLMNGCGLGLEISF